MKTILDLTDCDSPAGGDPLPDPSTIHVEGDNVVLSLREVDVHLTLGQCFAFAEAFNKWSFRGLRGEVDLNRDSYPVDELHRMREVVGRMINDGHVFATGRPEVAGDVRAALRHALSEDNLIVEDWQDQQATIRGLQEENVTLRSELEALKKRRAKAAAKGTP